MVTVVRPRIRASIAPRRGPFGVMSLAAIVALVAACAPPSSYLHGDNPSGALDVVTLTPAGVRVSGWAADRNTQDPIDVVVWVDGRLQPGRHTAAAHRPDVGSAVGRPNSGYDISLTVAGASTSTLVCVSALNVGPGASSLLGCRRGAVTPPPPTSTTTTTAPPVPSWLAVGGTARMSLTADGDQSIGSSANASISADGRYVAFDSASANIVAGDSNSASDVFVRDNETGTTTMVSVDSGGTQGDDGSYEPSISADGRFVAFGSYASNLVTGGTDGRLNVFVHDTDTGTTTLASPSWDGGLANNGSFSQVISADGRFVAFSSYASNLVSDDSSPAMDVFVHDIEANTTVRVSLDTDGIQANNNSSIPAISADGRYVAFHSTATNLVPDDTNSGTDVFVRDTITSTTTRVSVASGGSQGDNGSSTPSISPDGRYVTFQSIATNLVPGDTNSVADVFVRDTVSDTTIRASLASDGGQGTGSSFDSYVSADGRYVAFVSSSSNLVATDSNGSDDVFVRDTTAGTTTRVSVASNGTEANNTSNLSQISADGRFVLFSSVASNLVSGDTNTYKDIFVHRYH